MHLIRQRYFKLCLLYTVSRSIDSRKKQRCINLYHAALLTVNIRRDTLPLKAQHLANNSNQSFITSTVIYYLYLIKIQDIAMYLFTQILGSLIPTQGTDSVYVCIWDNEYYPYYRNPILLIYYNFQCQQFIAYIYINNEIE